MKMPEIWFPAGNQRCPATISEAVTTPLVKSSGERSDEYVHKCSNYRGHEGQHYDAQSGRKW